MGVSTFSLCSEVGEIASFGAGYFVGEAEDFYQKIDELMAH